MPTLFGTQYARTTGKLFRLCGFEYAQYMHRFLTVVCYDNWFYVPF